LYCASWCWLDSRRRLFLRAHFRRWVVADDVAAQSIIPLGGLMPGWGTGNFENDDAQKFLGALHLKEPEDLQKILIRAAADQTYLHTSESSIAIVAGEVVAAGRGNPCAVVPPQIAEWVKKVEGAPSAEMIDLAVRAVDRVRTNSELKDLWLEAEGLNEWSAALRELVGRLAG
jgi:Domain of unknown function (DUF4259)